MSWPQNNSAIGRRRKHKEEEDRKHIVKKRREHILNSIVIHVNLERTVRLKIKTKSISKPDQWIKTFWFIISLKITMKIVKIPQLIKNHFNIDTSFANIYRNGSKAHGKSRNITWRLNKSKDKDLILQAQKSARGINRPNLTFYICQQTGRNQIWTTDIGWQTLNRATWVRNSHFQTEMSTEIKYRNVKKILDMDHPQKKIKDERKVNNWSRKQLPRYRDNHRVLQPSAWYVLIKVLLVQQSG